MEKSTKIIVGASAAIVVTTTIYLIFRKNINVLLKQNLGGYDWFETGLDWYRNSTTKSEVNKLHPKFQDDVKEFFSWIEKNTDYAIVFNSGHRTFEDQQRMIDIYGNGAAPVGKSNHNYGFAIDINLRNKKTGKTIMKADKSSYWLNTGIPQQAKKMGFIWGGDFNNYDPVHFAKDGMPSTTQMLALHNAGKVDSNGYIKV
jgi:hypothetical protein